MPRLSTYVQIEPLDLDRLVSKLPPDFEAGIIEAQSMNRPLEQDGKEQELFDYLRIFVMFWQKIDFIWGLFITSYIPLFGFLHFYQGQIGGSFGLLFVIAIGAFTWVNGAALRSHYDLANTMSKEFRRNNRSYPDLNAALLRTANDGKERLVLFTHGFAFAGFLYMMGERVGETMCGTKNGWGCLIGSLIGAG